MKPGKAGLVIPLLGFAALVALFVFGLKQDPDRALPSPLVGKALPPFQLPRLDQPRTVVDSAAIEHHRWVFNVWASWCVPCRDELPVLQSLARESSVPVIGLNYKDKAEDAHGLLRQFGNPYAYSVVDDSGRYGIELGVYGVPETFIIDDKGVILFKHVGPLTPQIMRNEFLARLVDKEGS